MGSFDDTFAAELRALRPAPDPAFAAALDERAAAGFPHRPEHGGDAPLARLRVWLEGLTPRRALVPGGAAALTLVIVVAAVVTISQSGSSQSSLNLETSATSESGEVAAGGNEELGRVAPLSEPGTSAGAGTTKPSPPVQSGAEEGAGTEEGAESRAYGAEAGVEKAPKTYALPAPRNRDIERSASIVLGTTPDKLPEASARVYEAVHAARGVVLNSSIRGGKRTGEARFELLIPSGKLDAALATFSGIAEVRSRHDTTADITAPTVSASEELRDSNARLDGLVKQLGEAGTESEREAVEAELRGERNHHADLRASLERLKDRADMSRVSLRIVSDHGAGVTPGGDSGSWGAGDALGDAGHILTVAGGVAIIGLAIVGPIALILLAIWLAQPPPRLAPPRAHPRLTRR